ncbi:MAG: ABC transporter substrate-binding protein [Pelagibacteraceae bacterium]|nr:ABC transporter substrate-binding protein [Pelagibacteraceae bacterium]
MFKIKKYFLILALLYSFNVNAVSQDGKEESVKVGVLKWGTANWELKTLTDKKLDNKNKYTLEVVGLGSKNASATALQGGEVDVILSDYIWVNRQRAEGADFTFVPHSLTVGGLITRPDSGINNVSDLKGKKIGIAGGPVDKSWVILQAYAKEKHGMALKDEVETVFAAPAVINEQLMEGNVDAVLNFWHYNARLKAAGMTEVISVKDVLDQLNLNHETPLLGWVFDKTWAEKNSKLVTAFLNSSFQTKEILLNDLGQWENLKKKMKADEDETLFVALRDAYRDGIVSEFKADHISSASEVFAVMASIGGEKLVGSADKLDEDTFWKAYIE